MTKYARVQVLPGNDDSSNGLVYLHGIRNRSIVVYNPISGEITPIQDYQDAYDPMGFEGMIPDEICGLK